MVLVKIIYFTTKTPTNRKNKTMKNGKKSSLGQATALLNSLNINLKRSIKSKKPKSRSPKSMILQAKPRFTGYRAPVLSFPASKYLQAQQRPFHPSSIGARAPVLSNIPTNTYFTTGIMQFAAPASAASGCVILTHHPILTVLDLGIVNGLNSTVSSGCATNFASFNPGLLSTTPVLSLSNTLSSYRTVACGYRIRVRTPELYSTGDIIVAPLISASGAPGYNALFNIAMSSTGTVIQNICGGHTTATMSSTSLLSIPGARQFTAQELMGKAGLTLHPRPITMEGFKFHLTSNNAQYNATYNEGTEVLINASASLTAQTDLADYTDLYGWENFAVYFFNFPASQPTIEIEYIHHYEGTTPAATTGLTLQPTGSAIVDNVEPTSVMNSIRRMGNVVLDTIEAGANMYDYTKRSGILRATRALL